MGFDFRLLSDTDRKAAAAYGVERPDSLGGGTRRATFVIDPVGMVRLVYVVDGCQIPLHAERVLQDIQLARGNEATPLA